MESDCSVICIALSRLSKTVPFLGSDFAVLVRV